MRISLFFMQCGFGDFTRDQYFKTPRISILLLLTILCYEQVSFFPRILIFPIFEQPYNLELFKTSKNDGYKCWTFSQAFLRSDDFDFSISLKIKVCNNFLRRFSYRLNRVIYWNTEVQESFFSKMDFFLCISHLFFFMGDSLNFAKFCVNNSFHTSHSLFRPLYASF